MTHKELRLNLAYSDRPPADLSRLKGKHFSNSAKIGGKRGRCKVCGSKKTENGKRKDTKIADKYVQCDVYLCEGLCFTKYLTKGQS